MKIDYRAILKSPIFGILLGVVILLLGITLILKEALMLNPLLLSDIKDFVVQWLKPRVGIIVILVGLFLIAISGSSKKSAS